MNAELREKSFGYTKFDENGEKVIVDRKGKYKDMMMDIWSYDMPAGSVREACVQGDELIVLLVTGEADFTVAGETMHFKRGSFTEEKMSCVHVCKNTPVKVQAVERSEIVLISTENDKEFKPVFYTPDKVSENMACAGMWENHAVRKVWTAIDASVAPYSNLVLGETIMLQGCWSGFVPHYHAQPELYYFRIENPAGFGASFVGDEVFKITDGSFAAIGSNLSHPQVAAPGYPIYYLWLIRHLPGNPWSREGTPNEPQHEWLLKK